jgi:hypothetical protein
MRKMLKQLLAVAWCVAVLGVWIGGIVHSFRHHGIGDRVLAIFVPPWGAYRGVEGFFSNESGMLGFNLDDGSAKMQHRIQEEHEKEETLRNLLSIESDRIESIPADNTDVAREQERLGDKWRAKLYNFRATVTDPRERAKVGEFLRLMDELDASFQRQKEPMDQLAKKFPVRDRSSAR